jgi:hypothetical protein
LPSWWGLGRLSVCGEHPRPDEHLARLARTVSADRRIAPRARPGDGC